MVQDDLDMETGKVKCRDGGGGSGGHNGIRSLVAWLERVQDFPGLKSV